MNVTIHSIERSFDSPDLIELGVTIGDSPITRYRTTFNDTDSAITCCEIESDLFMSLWDIAHTKYARSTVLQVELMGIVKAFSKQQLDLELPATLGTTKYCVLKPSALGIAYNKIRYHLSTLLWRIGFGRIDRKAESNCQNTG